jgi:hypothetical protein
MIVQTEHGPHLWAKSARVPFGGGGFCTRGGAGKEAVSQRATRSADSGRATQYDKDVLAGCAPESVVRRHFGFITYRAEPVSQTTVDLSGITRSPDGFVVVKYFTIPSDG